MGGHSKKSGRGGGGGGRTARHERARPLKKDPGVPDLRSAASRLAHTAAKRTHSLFASSNGNSQGGSGALVRSVWQRRTHTVTASTSSADDGQRASSDVSGGHGADNDVDARRAEMTSLALRAAERLHEHCAPLQLLLHDDGAQDVYGHVATHALDAATLAMASHERSVDEVLGRSGGGAGSSLRRFYKSFQRVVESCDVLLQVVDARDPLGCRLVQLEQNIRSTYGDERKKIVMVLNKVDLLPSPQVADAWVTYFEQHEHLVCVPFAATAKGASGQSYVSRLYRRLRALARGAGATERKAIVVGVIGYPNVGKSSIINALKRRPVVGVGNVPGFTTGNTEVELRSDIRVLDCPGVVCADGTMGDTATGSGGDSSGGGGGDVVLRNAIKISDVANPITPVQRLLQRCTQVYLGGSAAACGDVDTPEQHGARGGQPMVHPLALYYGIGAFDVDDVYDFLHHVGVRRGRLLKGGRVDEEATARMVLHDWTDGRIPYYTLPPTLADMHHDGSLRAADYHVPSATEHRRRRGGDDNSGNVDGDDESMQPQLVSLPSCGLVVDGLPTFHLDLRGIARQRSGNDKWVATRLSSSRRTAHGAVTDAQDSSNNNSGEEEVEEEEL